MVQRLALILVWIALSLLALWAILRFVPALVRFFRREFERAKDKLTNTDTMIIKIKKEPKKDDTKENHHA